MLCRALFAAIVVSYVLCVLLMSGVHKEELDAQTLRKLQRHNVNIADIDDQKLRDQCFVDNYVSSVTTDRVDLKEHKRSREQPAFVDENGASKAQLTRIINYLKNQEKHKKETTTKSVDTTETIDLNSLFSLIKNISLHESITEASTDSPPNVTNKDSAKPTLKKMYEYFKKQAESIKKTRKTNVHNENLELNPLNTQIKKPDPESTITKEQLQEILDDYFKKQDIKDTTSRPVSVQSGTTTKSNIAELSSLLSNKNHDIEFIADSVSRITLKSGKAKDRENISSAVKENKSREIINSNKKLPETSNQQIKPQVFNDIEYVSKIVARILSQKQQIQAQTATINSNEKKHVRDMDIVEHKILDIKTTTPTSHVLNKYNLTENELLDTVEPRSYNKQNDLINALLKELRNRDRLLTRYKEESSSNYDQYNIDNRNQKQLKNSLEEEPKGTMYKLRGTSNQAAGIFSRLKNRPVIDARYKSKQPLNIHSWNSKEEDETKLPNQPSERGKTNMQNTIDEYYPEANRHHKRKWVYYTEEREQTPEPAVEMEQKTDILREPYNTMNNENDRNLNNAYKPPWQYFSNRRNSKEINPSSNQKNGLRRQYKSIINTINNENYPTIERKPKYEWPVYYEDAIMAGNLQLQNNNALVNKPNELQKPENTQERIPTDRGSPLMEPVLSKWFKNKWPNPQSGTSFKKEPKSTEELMTKNKQFFNNRKSAYQNDLQINNDNILLENETLYDNLKKYLLDENVKKLKDEIKNKDQTKVLNVKDNNLSPKVLKQIADTVKAIVLEDLKKEKSTINVFSTTPSTTTVLTEQTTHATDTTTTTTATTTTTTVATTTTTEITSTTPKEQQKLQDASKALEQFMRVFEKFQLLKYQLNPDNGTQQQNLDVVKEQNFQVLKPPVLRNLPVFYERPQQKSQKQIILDPYTDKDHWVKMQIPPHRRAPPVMFQTNSNEIPPLRLPLEKPVLFNTVLLTTRATPLSYDQPVDLPDNPPRSIHKSVRVAPYARLKPEQSNTNDDQPRDKYEESFRPRHIGNHIGKLLGKDYFHNVKKIHEKMEREERPPRSSKKCTSSNGCSDKISQRKQRPLGRGSNFDDKHFKNFLKTQQKVNAMLERILATKAKRSHPMSTEII